MDWLIFLFALEIGWMPQGALLMYERMPNDYYEYEEVYFNYSFFTDLEAKVLLFNHFYIGGGAKTVFLKRKDGWTFSPQTINYKFMAGIKIGMIDLFFRHHCLHPVMTYMYWYEPNLKWEGAYGEIGIRIEGKIDGR